jgi:hypothetical protein
MTSKEQIRQALLELLEKAPDGITYSTLIQSIKEHLPEIPTNTIHGSVWELTSQLTDKIWRPARGLYMHARFRQAGPKPEPPPQGKLNEERFYKPFADWLVEVEEECTRAIPVGGNKFKNKWGTPDVIGVREPKKSDIIKFETEIVSAEVKVDSTNLITAFGQACAYRLFSHKSYIVVPASSPPDDLERLKTLCVILGVGLILFNAADIQNPGFDLKARAAKHEPDMFYVNLCMKIIEDELFS